MQFCSGLNRLQKGRGRRAGIVSRQLQQRHARHGAVGSVVLQTLAQCVTGRTLGGFCTAPGISLGINLGIKARLGINARNPAQVIGKVGIAMQLGFSLSQQHPQHQQQPQAKLYPVTGSLQIDWR